VVNNKVNKAGLVGILGEVHLINTQGEGQQKLDIYVTKYLYKLD
jgi:fructose-1,6-bisphosphatase